MNHGGVGLFGLRAKNILTWRRGIRDHDGGAPRVRPVHCTFTDGLTPAILPNVENSGVKFMVVEDCVRAILLNQLNACGKEETPKFGLETRLELYICGVARGGVT